MRNKKSVTVEMSEDLQIVVEEIKNLYAEVSNMPDARGLEMLVHNALKNIDKDIMQTCIKKKAEDCTDKMIREVKCKHCADGWALLVKEDADRSATTLDGESNYKRPVFRCNICGIERAPFDEELGLEPKEHYTPAVQNKAAWAGVMLTSYQKAEEDMAHQAEIEISNKQIQRITEKTGKRALEIQAAEVKERGQSATKNNPASPGRQVETLVVEMDGTCVMGKDGVGHEVKCATVFGLEDRVQKGKEGQERHILINRLYCATSTGIQAFRAMVWVLMIWWGACNANLIVVIGDGGEWIWGFVRDRFKFVGRDGCLKRIIEILDFYHACENLMKACQSIYKNPEGKDALNWYEKWRDKIRAGKVSELINELTKRSNDVTSQLQKNELRTRAEYFKTHAHRMDYPLYEAMNLPIGSGAIEGTCKNLIKGRMSCVGQRWEEEKVEQMVSLRVMMFNNRWNDLWDSHQKAA